MAKKSFAQTSWAHLGKMIARRCSQDTIELENDLMCLEVLLDATKDKNCPDNKDTIRRVGIVVFYDISNEKIPISAAKLEQKLKDDFDLNVIEVVDLNGTSAVIAEEYVSLADYTAQITLSEDCVWNYSEHKEKPFTKV